VKEKLRQIARTPIERIVSTGARCGLSRAGTLLEEWWAHAGGLDVNPGELTAIVKGRPLTPSDAAAEILRAMADVAAITEDVVSKARECFPSEMASLRDEADRLCERRFRILGEDVDYSQGIRWHHDPRNHHEFEAGDFYARIAHSSPSGGYDIKYPWELSRLQHLPRLALAHRITGEKRYLAALCDHAGDWIARNPVGFGPNWACTMDVSIRAANLSFAFAVVGKSPMDSDLAVELTRSLIAHGRFIANHLEWSEKLASNHYLADIAGLAVLAALLSPVVPEARDWLRFARDELGSEITKQVYPDGWDFEASTAYHRLALECFLVPAIVLERLDKWEGRQPVGRSERVSRSRRDDEDVLAMGNDYLARLASMAGFVRDITMPDGSFPLIGDNDSGLFVSLQPRQIANLDYLLALSAAYLGDESLKPRGLPPTPEILWLLGENGVSRFENLSAAGRRRTAEYPAGGLWCLRSDDELDMLTFRLGPVGQNGNGGHAHNDQLSVTIWFGGKPVIVDPGSAVYTSDPRRRNIYRSTGSHATVLIGSEEQNRFVNGNLFTLPQEVETECARLESGEKEGSLEGILRGYGPWARADVLMRRLIRHDRTRRQFEIEDEVELSETVREEVGWHFPLACGLVAIGHGAGYLVIQNESGETVADVLFYPGWRVEFVETSFSPEYGIELGNVTMRFKPPSDDLRARFIFRPVAPDAGGRRGQGVPS